jgi:hypothetical protein
LWIALAASGVALAGEPLGLDRLRELLDGGIDTEVLVALVKKDCVEFDVSGENVAELSRKLPKEVLRAAIECAGGDVAQPFPVETPGSPETAADPLCAYIDRVVDATVRNHGFAYLKGKRRKIQATSGSRTQPTFKWAVTDEYAGAERCWITQTSDSGELLRCNLAALKKRKGVDQVYESQLRRLDGCLSGWKRESLRGPDDDDDRDWLGTKFTNDAFAELSVLLVRTTKRSSFSPKRAVQLRVWHGYPVRWGL